jgi:serine/threonine protein kinase
VDYGSTYSQYSQGHFSKGEKFIIIKKLGISIYTILMGNHQNLRKIDVLKSGIQMIKVIEKFHNLGFVHLDLKVNNILFGANDKAYNYNSLRDYSQMVNQESKE